MKTKNLFIFINFYYYFFQIGNPIHQTNKRIIWIDGGIHAREWASIHTVLYFIDQVIIGK